MFLAWLGLAFLSVFAGFAALYNAGTEFRGRMVLVALFFWMLAVFLLVCSVVSLF